MLVALFGVAGVGKSYYKDKIVENLNFKKIVILTTREKRPGEIDGIDKWFVTEEELQNKIKNNEIGYCFELLGNKYAYLKGDLLSDQNFVAEVHYTEIYGLKKVCPNMFSIYLVPNNIEVPKKILKERNLKPEIYEKRLNEIEEFDKNKELQNQFNCILYNNYDLESEKKLLEFIKNNMEILNFQGKEG